jgi:hypothetical protein
MSIFKKLFQRPPEINASSAKIDAQVYLLNYQEHYAKILGQFVTPPRLSELFIFRAWTAQFGYRIFSRVPDASEKLIGETINSTRVFGLSMFEGMHGFSVETELGAKFMDLVEDRWGDYDVVIERHGKSGLPTVEVVTALTARLNVADPVVFSALAMDFLSQLGLIKRTAQELGLLQV